MKLYLIRHAETVHNVAQAWAGTTDSALTNHGVLQIDCLARHLVSTSIHFDSIYSSDLSRARLTAEGICCLQPPKADGTPLTPLLTPDLREKDFGSLEGMSWNSSATSGDAHVHSDAILPPRHHHAEIESTASMRQRATTFFNTHIIPLLFDAPESVANVAIVAHGIILRVLWNCLVELFDPMNVSIAPGIPSLDGRSAALVVPGWSNTGFMTLLVQQHRAALATNSSLPDHENTSPGTLLQGWHLRIMAINSRDHLLNLRRTRGGIGSATHDTRQKRIDQFFKR